MPRVSLWSKHVVLLFWPWFPVRKRPLVANLLPGDLGATWVIKRVTIQLDDIGVNLDLISWPTGLIQKNHGAVSGNWWQKPVPTYKGGAGFTFLSPFCSHRKRDRKYNGGGRNVRTSSQHPHGWRCRSFEVGNWSSEFVKPTLPLTSLHEFRCAAVTNVFWCIRCMILMCRYIHCILYILYAR